MLFPRRQTFVREKPKRDQKCLMMSHRSLSNLPPTMTILRNVNLAAAAAKLEMERLETSCFAIWRPSSYLEMVTVEDCRGYIYVCACVVQLILRGRN